MVESSRGCLNLDARYWTFTLCRVAFFVSRCVLDGADAIGLLVLLWYIYIDACVLAPLATVSCSIQIDLVVFVHTAYGVEHILDPQKAD